MSSYDPGIECPVCHRMEFEGHQNCQECHWPVRNVLNDAETFGCDVLIEVQTAKGRERIERHYVGNEKKVRRSARRVSGYRAVIAVRRLTKEAYIQGNGDPDRRFEKFS